MDEREEPKRLGRPPKFGLQQTIRVRMPKGVHQEATLFAHYRLIDTSDAIGVAWNFFQSWLTHLGKWPPAMVEKADLTVDKVWASGYAVGKKDLAWVNKELKHEATITSEYIGILFQESRIDLISAIDTLVLFLEWDRSCAQEFLKRIPVKC